MWGDTRSCGAVRLYPVMSRAGEEEAHATQQGTAGGWDIMRPSHA
jgi:hypothetical protein